MKLKNIIGSMASKFAALVLTFGLAGGAWADAGATLTPSGKVISESEFSAAILKVEPGGTYNGNGDTVTITNPRAGVFGSQNSARSTPITIKDVVFQSGGDTLFVYVYFAGTNITFDNCVFDHVGALFSGVKDTRLPDSSLGGYLETVNSVFVNCTFKNINDYAVKNVFNTTIQGCAFTNVKRAIMVSAETVHDIPVNNVAITSNDFGPQTNKDRIIKFYNVPTDSESRIVITNNTIDASYWVENAAFIQTNFNYEGYDACDYTSTVFVDDTNTGVTVDNLNENGNHKILTLTVSASPATSYVAKLERSGEATQYFTDLHAALEAGKAQGSVVTLLADVDLTGVAWTPVGSTSSPFCGTFDGDGHTIGNLTFDNATATALDPDGDGGGWHYLGLFGYAENAAFADLVLTNVNISASVNRGYYGSLVGYEKNSAVSNVDVDDVSIFGEAHIGAVIGYAAGGSVTGCDVTGLVILTESLWDESGFDIGGIVGKVDIAQLVLNNCTVSGDSGSFVKSEWGAGGLLGYTGPGMSGSVSGCSVSGLTIEATSWGGAGGLMGFARGGDTITGCTVSNVTVIRTDSSTPTTNLRTSGLIVGCPLNTTSSKPLTMTNCTMTDSIVYRAAKSGEAGYSFDLCGDDGYSKQDGQTGNPATTSESGNTITFTSVAAIGTTFYATFADAIAAVQDGQTIVVINYNAETMIAPEGWEFVTEDGVTTLVRKPLADYVTFALTIDDSYAAAYPDNVAAARAMYEGKKYASLAEAQAAFASLFGWNGNSFDAPNNGPFKNATASNGPTPVTKVTFDLYGTTECGKITLGNFSDSSLYLMSVEVVGHDGAKISGNVSIDAKVAGGYDNHHTTSGKLLVKDIEFTATSDNISCNAGCANIGTTDKVVEPSEMEIVGCTFHTQLYTYSNYDDAGKMTYNIHGNTFSGDPSNDQSFAFCLQGGEQGYKGPNVINFYNNTVSGYKRGIQLQPNSSDPTMKKTVNVYGNTITPGTGYSAVQISAGNEVNIYNNTIILNAANAITLHELLTGGIAISFTGNTVSLADGASVGYMVYDDAYAGNNAEALAKNLTFAYADNTIGAGIDTTQGVKGSNAFGIRKYVYDILNPVYVAQIGDDKYESLADAIAAVPNNTATTITILSDVDLGTLTQAQITAAGGNAGLITIPAGKVVTLDLNGHRLYGTLQAISSGYNKNHVLLNSGTLTVVDSGVGGSIENLGTECVDCCYTIENASGATMYLNGGTFSTASGALMINRGACEINSGVEMTSDGWYRGAYSNASSVLDNRGTVTINGGTFKSTHEKASNGKEATATIFSYNSTTIINGGTFIGQPENGVFGGGDGNYTVTGGSFSSDPQNLVDSTAYYVRESSGMYTVSPIVIENYNVATSAELLEKLALADAKSRFVNCKLTDDITLSADAVVAHGSQIELNGHRLTVGDGVILSNDGTIISGSDGSTVQISRTGFLTNPYGGVDNDNVELVYAKAADENGVYEISTPMDLQWLSYFVKTADFIDDVTKIVFADDIAIPSGVGFEMIGGIDNKEIDGNGKSVSGVVINGISGAYGMFEYLAGVYIHDLDVTASVSTVNAQTGILAAIIKGGTTVKNVTVNGRIDVSGSAFGVAGFAGAIGGGSGEVRIVCCTNNADIYAPNATIAGGFHGTSSSFANGIYYISCENTGDMTSGGYAAQSWGYGYYNLYLYDFTGSGTMVGATVFTGAQGGPEGTGTIIASSKVARTGTPTSPTFHDDLASAITAAAANGSTIVLLKDCADAYELTVGSTLVIDEVAGECTGLTAPNGYVVEKTVNGTIATYSAVVAPVYVAQNTTTGVKYETLAAAIADANAGDTVKLLADIDLGTENVAIDKALTLTSEKDENGKAKYGITSSASGYAVQITGSGDITLAVNVTATAGGGIQAGTSTSSAYTGKLTVADNTVLVKKRGINVYGSGATVLNTENAIVTTGTELDKYTADDNSRGVNLMGALAANLKDTIVQGFSYCVNMPSSGSGLTVKMTGGKTYGRAALNVWGSNNAFTLDGVEVHGLNNQTGPTEAFACIVENKGATNNTYNINGCTFNAELSSAAASTSGSSASEQMIDLRGTQATVKITGATTYTAKIGDETIAPTDEAYGRFGLIYSANSVSVPSGNSIDLDSSASASLADVLTVLPKDVETDDSKVFTDGTSLGYVPEVHYYWATASGFEGGYYDFNEPFDNGWLAEGEYIDLYKATEMDKDVSTTVSFTLNLKGYTLTAGSYKIRLGANSIVTSDTSGLASIFAGPTAEYDIKETENGDGTYAYTPVIYEYMVTFAQGDVPVGVGTLALPDAIAFTKTSADITLPLPTYTAEGVTFAGWKNSANEIVTAIAAGTTGNVTLTATWTAAEKVKVEIGEGTEAAKVEVVIPEQFFEDKTDKIAEAGGKSAYLETSDDNGLKKWQNYVMGIDGSKTTNKLAPIGGEPKSERIVVVKTPVETFTPPTADTGVTVKYALYWRAAGSDTWTQYGDFMDAPTFGVDIVGDITAAETYWKIEAVFTASSATATETSGASEESQESGN